MLLADDLAVQRGDCWRGHPSPWTVWKGTAVDLRTGGQSTG